MTASAILSGLVIYEGMISKIQGAKINFLTKMKKLYLITRRISKIRWALVKRHH